MDQDHELWRTLRCAAKVQDKTSVDTLMLKYRPIAPKPTTTAQPVVGDTSSTRRTKRKYVRVSKNKKATCRSNNGFRSNSTDPRDGQEDIVTLQLMPERSTPLRLDHNNLDPTVETKDETCKTDTWLKFNGSNYDALHQVPVETWVTVESVNNSDSVSHAVGCTDEEIADAIDKDTCPGFVSDTSNHVVMVNEAYRRIVTEDGGFGGEVIVWLVVDQTTTFCDYRTFTCKVKLEYTWRETKYTKTVPCDVWKMEFGGFAWRLDAAAALTLWL